MFWRVCLRSVGIMIVRMKEFHALPIKNYFFSIKYWVQSWIILHHSILFFTQEEKAVFFSLMNILTVCQATLFVLAKCIYVGFKRILKSDNLQYNTLVCWVAGLLGGNDLDVI